MLFYNFAIHVLKILKLRGVEGRVQNLKRILKERRQGNELGSVGLGLKFAWTEASIKWERIPCSVCGEPQPSFRVPAFSGGMGAARFCLLCLSVLEKPEKFAVGERSMRVAVTFENGESTIIADDHCSDRPVSVKHLDCKLPGGGDMIVFRESVRRGGGVVQLLECKQCLREKILKFPQASKKAANS
jgi:hypothetical protein